MPGKMKNPADFHLRGFSNGGGRGRNRTGVDGFTIRNSFSFFSKTYNLFVSAPIKDIVGGAWTKICGLGNNGFTHAVDCRKVFTAA
jgi:hypothetical protein